jgi:hypothetical protein
MIPTSADDLTTEWFQSVLGPDIGEVTSVAPIGTGLMAYCLAVEVGGRRLAVKFAGTDATVLQSGAYFSEVAFYREIAPRLSGGIAKCHHADISVDGLQFVLVLDDLSPAVQGDQILGCSSADAEAAVLTLARLHAPLWNDESIRMFNAPPGGPEEAVAMFQTYMGMANDAFKPRFESMISAEDMDTLMSFGPRAAEWAMARQDNFSIAHGDYRLDNLLFDGADCFAVDWQTAMCTLPLRDLGFFCATSLKTENRRSWERELVGLYHRTLGRSDYSLETCWDDYRFGIAQATWVTIIGAWAARQTERGDQMFVAMATRTAAAMRDLETMSTF